MADATGSDVDRNRVNVELKARVDSLARLRPIAQRLATERLGELRQTDTYFRCATGRLKLRECVGAAAQLIWYSRPDESDAKTCRYQLVEIADAAGLKAALASACGVWIVVEKRREVFLHHNVRIHLDEVSGLGEFIEFEAVLENPSQQDLGERQIAMLRTEFGIVDADLLEGSYSDFLSG